MRSHQTKKVYRSFAVLSVLAAFLGGSPCLAQNRPDLIQTKGQPFSTTPGNIVYLSASGSTGSPFFKNVIYLGASGNFNADDGNILWTLYEPDKIKRTGNKVQLNQGKNVFVMLNVDTTYTAFTTSGFLADCKAKIAAKDTDANAVLDQAKWSLNCKSGALDDLGLTLAQKAAFLNAFGTAAPQFSGEAP